MTPPALKELVFLNLTNAEVQRRNMDTAGAYQPTEQETVKQILMNQQCIMLMLSQLLYKNSEILADYLENKITYDKDYDRWVIGK